MFAAIRTVLIDPLPYRRADRLVQLRSEFPGVQRQASGDWVVWNDAREIAVRTRTLGAPAVYRNAVFDLAGDGNNTPEALYGVLVTANLFPVLGVAPMIGRNVLPEEDQRGHTDVMILSYGLWTRRFHSDRSVVGRTVTISGHGCLVIGVMPPEFNFPMRRGAAHTPSPYVEFWAAPFSAGDNANAGFGAIARLRGAASLADARQDLAAISRDLAHDFPATNRERILTLNVLRDRIVGAAGPSLMLLMAAAVLFMLIGCANVANLLLARGLARQREISVRLAIGAGQWRIARQLLTESCVLALAGGLGGYALTAAAWKILPSIAPVSIPRLAASRADTSVFVFAMALAAINGILFGIAPALRITRWSGFGARGAAMDRGGRMRSALVASEIALAVLLVVTGGRVAASFVRLISADPGFEAGRVLASVVLPAPDRYRDADRRALFYRKIFDAVRALPGVESAGTVDALPFSGENHGGFVSDDEPPRGQRMVAEIDVAGGEYQRAMGMHLLEGRWFREEEMSPDNDSAVVDTLVARRFWPSASAIGQRICVFCTPENPRNWKRVIGVVASASHSALDEPETGSVFLAAGAMQRSVFVVARTVRPAAEMERAVRRSIAAIDPNQPVFLSASMRELIADSVADRRFIVLLLAITGSLALILASAGAYGMISYTTSRRTQEIGVRMAVGATPRDVLSLIFRQGFAAVAIGLAIGLAAAAACFQLLGALLPGLQASPAVYVWIAAALVTLTAAVACWIPARRAMKIDANTALRQE